MNPRRCCGDEGDISEAEATRPGRGQMQGRENEKRGGTPKPHRVNGTRRWVKFEQLKKKCGTQHIGV